MQDKFNLTITAHPNHSIESLPVRTIILRSHDLIQPS
jgi:hypothetical protein